MTASVLTKPLMGNRELKLALTHIQTWFIHHKLDPKNLTIRLDFQSFAEAANAENIFRANMDPEDKPVDFLDRTWDYNGIVMKFDCTLQSLAKLVREKEAEIVELKRELASFRSLADI